ncbi:MAG: cysteine desulfurase NifS [Deltaproteobacteria bacterium]|nr:cysteine desulfurase NifS [Deltaproteobacteria bacterium]
MKPIYVDNNATTRVAEEVFTSMQPYFCEEYGNPSSMHSVGGRVGPRLKEARDQVANLLGARSDEIIFTSCGTESDNTAVHAALAADPDKRHIVTSRVEHPAIGSLVNSLSKQGYRISEIPVDGDGCLDMDNLEESLTPDTALVSIMWANNETGVIFPVEEIAQMCRQREITFHTDAVQAVGKLPVNLNNSAIDMLSLSGHKLHAPKGVGALYVRKRTKFTPFMIGGHQEKGRRAGTENVPGIIALGKACELAGKNMAEENTRVKNLRDHLETELIKHIPDAKVNGTTKQRTPNTSNISFANIEGESILLMLNEFGICASSGSACTSGSLEPSHVMRAMGVPFTMAHGSIRFSLSIYNTQADIDEIIKQLPPIVERLRVLSPFS